MYSPLIILLICAPTLALGSILGRSSGLVVFGDSDSDTGNVYNVLSGQTYPISPPYYMGRYCDGPIWVDDVTVSKKLDYAYGSATTDNTFVQGYAGFNKNIPVPGVLQQVAQYLNPTNKAVLKISLPFYLHVVWAGANDFIFSSSVTPIQVIDSLFNSLETLLNAGVKNLLVFNQPPDQYTPAIIASNQATAAAAAVQEANILLSAGLALLKISYPAASIYMFDTHSLITTVLASNQFINNNTACWTTVNPTTVIQNCPDPTKYVFVDEVHFSSAVEKIIADAVQPLLSFNFLNLNLGPYIIPIYL
jgi:phospholipase/lecithinase/hemolysin